jgi:hypothetical protein
MKFIMELSHLEEAGGRHQESLKCQSSRPEACTASEPDETASFASKQFLKLDETTANSPHVSR